jgi:sialic acid synthase SpsE
LALLHCVSSYPAEAADYNLQTIKDMGDRFNVVVGLSDHTIDNITATTSIALGASLVEKHFTLDRDGGGPDDSFSLEVDDLKSLCLSTKIAWKAMGSPDYSLKEGEKLSVAHRRSIYSIKEIVPGDVFSEENIKVIRPGMGLPPREFEKLLGVTATAHIPKGHPLNRELAGLKDIVEKNS